MGILIVRFLLRQLGIQGSAREKTQYRTYNSHGRPFGSRINTRSPYEILGVTPKSTRDEIKKKYRALVHQYHPDKVAHLAVEFREVAEKRIRDINAAYKELTR